MSLSRKWMGEFTLAGMLLVLAGAPATAGGPYWWSKCDCPTCKNCCREAKEKKRSSLDPAAAPEADVVFAIPAQVRPGQAVEVSESNIRRALNEAAARQLKESNEIAASSTDERLEKLEGEVKQIKDYLERLTLAVDKLTEAQAAIPMVK